MCIVIVNTAVNINTMRPTMTRFSLITLGLFLLAGIAPQHSFAHINYTSLSILGGETFTAGQKVTLTWKISIIHNRKHLIYFSESPEKSWQLFDSVPETAGKMDMKYEWTVPTTITSKARLRIYQSFAAKPGDKSDDYTIVSKEFSISPAVTQVQTVAFNKLRLQKQTVQIPSTFDLSGRRVDRMILPALQHRQFTARKFLSR